MDHHITCPGCDLDRIDLNGDRTCPHCGLRIVGDLPFTQASLDHGLDLLEKLDRGYTPAFEMMQALTKGIHCLVFKVHGEFPFSHEEEEYIVHVNDGVMYVRRRDYIRR
jgi:hypothetical protein